MKSFLNEKISDAYLEMCLGVMSLRIPEIQTLLVDRYPTAGIASSYTDQREDLILVVSNIIADIKREGLKGPQKLRSSFTQVNRVFLISMWDILINTETYSIIASEPEIQFLRHIRNGCAHDNRFKIARLNEPATWRDKTITTSLEGTPVLPDFLRDGDVYLLVHDIDRKFFGKTA